MEGYQARSLQPFPCNNINVSSVLDCSDMGKNFTHHQLLQPLCLVQLFHGGCGDDPGYDGAD